VNILGKIFHFYFQNERICFRVYLVRVVVSRKVRATNPSFVLETGDLDNGVGPWGCALVRKKYADQRAPPGAVYDHPFTWGDGFHPFCLLFEA
jgi:hypothetical protein